jgi:transposase
MGDRKTRAKWAVLVKAWKRSGLTAREFARQRGVKAGTLSWWNWRLGVDECAGASGRGPGLVAVKLDDKGEGGDSAWELSTARGDVLRVHDRIERDELAQVLAALMRRS